MRDNYVRVSTRPGRMSAEEQMVRRGFQLADFQIRHEPLWRRIVRRIRR